MATIWNIFKFVFLDNVRSIWAAAYMLFFAVSTYALIYFTGSFTRSMVSIMNIVILIAPLVSTMMTAMYYFNKNDLLFLLLAQPVKRSHVFLGIYLGVAIPLSLALVLGLSGGLLMAYAQVEDIGLFLTLVLAGVLLSLVFSSLSMFIAVRASDKLKGVGIALFCWLFLAVIYDGLMLMYFIVFSEYPIEQHAIVLSLLNPIDLSRIFIMLQLDVSALMGYSGAVFQKFFGTSSGVIVSLLSMLVWIVLPVLALIKVGRQKDY